VLEQISSRIRQGETKHSEFLTPVHKLCICLDFLRTNAFQGTIATQHHNRITQGRSCIIINEIASFIADLSGQVGE
jgi:hypothetical protein